MEQMEGFMKKIYMFIVVLALASGVYAHKPEFSTVSTSIIQSITDRLNSINNSLSNSLFKRFIVPYLCPKPKVQDIPSGIDVIALHCQYLRRFPIRARISLYVFGKFDSYDQKNQYSYTEQCRACDDFMSAYKKLSDFKKKNN